MPLGRRDLRSQRLREANFQGDALRMGMNWTEEDLAKPQLLVDSAYGMGHPGTFHFRPLIEEVSNGVFEAGGKPGVFTVSDICDGVTQAHAGSSYSLVSRDIMAAMIEIHALAHPHDGMVLISGNDKSVPAHLLAIARCDLPAIHLPGGTQLNGPGYVTSDQMWALGAAVIPTPLTRHLRYARLAGKQVLRLIAEDITPRRILTRQAFENAVILHAAVGGSTNALLHLPVIAHEVGVDLTLDDFDRIHRRVPVLANAKTTGRYPVEYLWYAGGVPGVMLELRDLLNLAPAGAVVKYFSVPDEMHVHVGPARVFDTENSATEALLARRVQPGDVVVIRYEGPRANGMPEMYFASAIIAADPALSTTTAVVTDGRYSGAAKGPAVGHVAPEALDGGPIALVQDGDLIEIHIPERRLAVVGVDGRRLEP